MICHLPLLQTERFRQKRSAEGGDLWRSIRIWRKRERTTTQRRRWRHFCGVVFFLTSSLIQAQEHQWAIGIGAGYTQFRMRAINEDAAKDVAAFRELGFPVEPLPQVKGATLYDIQGEFRYERDWALRIETNFGSTGVSTQVDGSDKALSMKRNFSLTDIEVGIIYFVPSMYRWFQPYTGLMAGFAEGRAHVETDYRAKDVSPPSSSTRADYARIGVTAKGLLGLRTNIISPLFAAVEIGYRFANMGQLEGKVTVNGVSHEESSQNPVDYSGFYGLITIGFGF
ncbi:MAG: hypothetical protein ACP5JH_10790 [Bacteroidota bacterium]